MRHPSWLLQPVSPQTHTAGWWLMPQTVLWRLNTSASLGTGAVSSVCALLGICPWQTQPMWEPASLTVRKSGLETNWSFHSWPFPSFPSTWIQLRTRSLIFSGNKGRIIEDCLLLGEVSFPKSCLCSVNYDKPGDSIAVSLQGSPKRHPNCPSCWPCALLLVPTTLFKRCQMTQFSRL